MLRAQKRLSKRELKEDPLITYYGKFMSFYDVNKKRISTALMILGGVIIALIFYAKNQQEDNERAGAQLSRVYQFFDNGQFETAINGIPEREIVGLKDIAGNFGGTHNGDLATYYLAESYFRSGKYELALEKFDDFSPGHPLLVVGKLAGMAGSCEGLGRFAEAADYFERAASKDADGVNIPELINNAARNFALAGNKDRALSLYKKLKRDHATTTFGRDADRFIARLSAS